MVETYGISEERFYYVDEATPGTTPANPTMLSIPHESLDPGLNLNNILIRGGGSCDLQAIKRGTQAPTLKVDYIVPSAAPIQLLQFAKRELDKSLSCQVIYWKEAFSSATNIISLLYTYMRIGKATVSCNIDDVIKASLELVGQTLVTGTTKISGATYSDYNGAINFDETYVNKDTTTIDRVAGWKFDINNNPRKVSVIRSTDGHIPKFVPFGKRELGGEILFEFESKTEMDEALADSEFDLTFGLGGTNKAIFQDCKWSNITHQKWLEDLISVRAQFDCKGPLLISET